MAASSTFGTSNAYVKYNITVNVNSQNIADNTSNITVTVRFWRTNNYETWGSGTCYCGINGTTYSQAVTPSQRITSSGIDLFSRTVTINHNNDGTKTVWVSALISLDTPLSSSDQGFNVTLPAIPRASTLTNADNFNDEQNPKIYFNNPAGFKLQLKMEAGGNDHLVVRDNIYPSSPYTFSLTTAERNSLRALSYSCCWIYSHEYSITYSNVCGFTICSIES